MGSWGFKKRIFMTQEEKIEFERLDEMEEQMNAEIEIYISKDHQQVLAIDKDEISEETRLTKGDAAPPTTIDTTSPKDDLSVLIGLTRGSKAKAYADSAVKKLHHSILILL